MSHIVTLTTKIHDSIAINAACRRLGLSEPIEGTAKLFSGEATGLLLHLPGWSYPAVIDPLSGTVQYDTYNGAWGDQKHLDRFVQAYAVARATQEARRKGLAVNEQVLADGSIKLQIHEGG